MPTWYRADEFIPIWKKILMVTSCLFYMAALLWTSYPSIHRLRPPGNRRRWASLCYNNANLIGNWSISVYFDFMYWSQPCWNHAPSIDMQPPPCWVMVCRGGNCVPGCNAFDLHSQISSLIYDCFVWDAKINYD